MKIYSATHVGNKRKVNEDTIYVSGEKTPVIAVVADGMGGHRAGKTASSMAVSLVVERIEELGAENVFAETFEEIVSYASNRIWETAKADPELSNMGTTLIAGIVTCEEFLIAHVGDSRAYLFSNGKLVRITTDHSYVQFLVERGILTSEEAENHPYSSIITRAVGMESVEVDKFTVPFFKGDVLMLCSDGLTKHVTDKTLEQCLSCLSENSAEDLILRALNEGGLDNISVIIVENSEGGSDG